MPIYEYRCADCGQRFEELVSASAQASPPCPECGAGSADRLFSSFATEWLPTDVSWHQMPSKHDMGGAEDPKSALISKPLPGGKKKKAKG